MVFALARKNQEVAAPADPGRRHAKPRKNQERINPASPKRKIKKRGLTPLRVCATRGLRLPPEDGKLFIFNMFQSCDGQPGLCVLGIISADTDKNNRFQLSTGVEKAVDNCNSALEATSAHPREHRPRHIKQLRDWAGCG